MCNALKKSDFSFKMHRAFSSQEKLELVNVDLVKMSLNSCMNFVKTVLNFTERVI